MTTIQLTVPDMACSACVETITKAVQAVDPTATVAADTKTKQVQVEATVSDGAVKQAIAQAGYSPQ